MIYPSISTSRMILHFLGSGDPLRGAGPAMARPNGPTPYFYADNMLNTWRISGEYGENIWKQKTSISHRNIQRIFLCFVIQAGRDARVQALVCDIPRKRCPLCDHFPSLSRFAMDDRTIKVEAKGLSTVEIVGVRCQVQGASTNIIWNMQGWCPPSYKLVYNIIN